MIQTGIARIQESDSDLYCMKVLRTIAAICNYEANQIEQEYVRRIDETIEKNILIEVLKKKV